MLVRPPELFGHPNPAAAYLPMHGHHPHHLNPMGNGKRKKSWTRAVFSHLQRKGLEKRFQIQKYITKPDRRQLAASLGLTDAQVSLRHALCKFLSLQRSQQQINEFYAEVKMSDFLTFSKDDLWCAILNKCFNFRSKCGFKTDE